MEISRVLPNMEWDFGRGGQKKQIFKGRYLFEAVGNHISNPPALIVD